MKYEEFKTELTGHIKDYLPMQYQSWRVFSETVDKVNCRVDAVTLAGASHTCAVPTLYVDKFYQQHQEGITAEEAVENAAKEFLAGIAYLEDIGPRYGLDHPMGQIIYVLINTEKNRHMLEGIPHREVLDLSLIYRLIIELPGDGINTAVITEEMAKAFGLSEEELYQLAKGNTRRLMPLETVYLGEQFHIIGNEKHLLGAAAMLYDEVLAMTAEKVGDDLYILPSSIHEVFTVPAAQMEADDLKKAVRAANRSVVKNSEVLSDNIYYYDKSQGCLYLIE